jgi:uncharacterized protein YjbJ (UPF0337 family)
MYRGVERHGDFLHLPCQATMNWDQVEGGWKQLKGKVQQRWGKITDDDFDVIDGKREELIARLQKHYGKERDELERDVDDWSKRAV